MLEIVHVSDLHLFVRYGLHQAILDLEKAFPLVRRLTQHYSCSFDNARVELPNALRRYVGREETLLILTGDIAALPYDSIDVINDDYYEYVQLLAQAARSRHAIPILGNHDYVLKGSSVFKDAKSNFEKYYRISEVPRHDYLRGSTMTLVFFLVDTTDTIVPATGRIPDDTLSDLERRLAEGKSGHLQFRDGTELPQDEYDSALKIAILHHFPVPRAAYATRMTWGQNLLLRLKNRERLIDICKDEVDFFLFGHSHLPMLATLDGMIAIDAGSTLATDFGYAPPDAQFQLIQIHDRDTVVVASYRWDDGSPKTFVPLPPAVFRRDSAGQWLHQP